MMVRIGRYLAGLAVVGLAGPVVLLTAPPATTAGSEPWRDGGVDAGATPFEAPNGVEQLYESSSGRAEPWTLGFDDWEDRFDADDVTVEGDDADTVVTAGGEQTRLEVDAVPDNDCDGETDHSVALEQGYMCTPDDWTNFEMTGYVRLTEPSDEDGAQDWTWYGNGGRHPSPGNADPCTGSAYKGSYHYQDAQVRWAKEQYHMAYAFRDWTDVEGGIDYTENPDLWLGMKVVRYEFERDGERGIRLELWLDLSGVDDDGDPANDWELVSVEEDTGGWQDDDGADATDCNAPEPDQIMFWGGPHVTYRWDDTESQLRLATVHEIVPPTG